jgi:predicted Zn-dependent protease
MKKLIYIVLGIGLVAGGLVLARSGYRNWRQKRLVRLAEDFLAKSDTTNATLCVQRALQLNPRDLSACRMFAELAERAGSRNGIWWRRRVVDMEPNLMQNRIDLAKTALVLGDLAQANEALAAIDATGKKTAEYHKAMGSLAWALNRYSDAEKEYDDAVRLEPTNAASQLNLAITRLVVDNGSRANAGRASLEVLRTNQTVRLAALRQLVQDALRNNALLNAQTYARELEEEPTCRFSDRLFYLDALVTSQDERFSAYLDSLERVSATNSTMAYELAGWLIHHGQARQALGWAQSIPPEVRTNLPFPMVMADGYTAIGAWQPMDSMLLKQDWKDMDYLRHLLRARALRAQNQTLASSVEWRSALTAASSHIESLNDIVKRTAAWNWGPELDECLWSIVENFPIEKGAFLALYDRLAFTGNTAALHNLLAKISSFVPLPLELKNNFAVVSLLVYPQGQHGHDLAREAYEDAPQNPFVVSTYAYSLYLQGKGKDALKLFDSIKREDLDEPSIAAYYGIILAGTGNHGQARHFIDLGLQARLLPEERNLLGRAGEGL